MQCNSLVRFQPRRRGCPSMWLLYHETVFKSMWFLAPSSGYNSIRGPSPHILLSSTAHSSSVLTSPKHIERGMYPTN